MKKPCLVLLFTFIFLCGCLTSRNITLQDQILAVLNNSQTEFSYTIDKIPSKMLRKAKKASEASWIYDGVYEMANPGDNFRSNCAGTDTLMRRRLIFMSRYKHRHVLCYERGGRSHNLLISYFRTDGLKSKYYNMNLQDVPVSSYTDMNQIQSALREGRFHLCYNNGKKPDHPSVPF